MGCRVPAGTEVGVRAPTKCHPVKLWPHRGQSFEVECVLNKCQSDPDRTPTQRVREAVQSWLLLGCPRTQSKAAVRWNPYRNLTDPYFSFVHFSHIAMSKLIILHCSLFSSIPSLFANKPCKLPAQPSVITWQRFRLAQFNTYSTTLCAFSTDSNITQPCYTSQQCCACVTSLRLTVYLLSR